jgi:hypothetical protein
MKYAVQLPFNFNTVALIVYVCTIRREDKTSVRDSLFTKRAFVSVIARAVLPRIQQPTG